jgi:hypothetical protein
VHEEGRRLQERAALPRPPRLSRDSGGRPVISRAPYEWSRGLQNARLAGDRQV